MQGWPLAGRMLTLEEAFEPAAPSSPLREPALRRPLRPCLFLDRDGVVIEDRHYAYRPSDLVLLPGVVPLIQWATSQGWAVCVVSNQAGVAKGYFTTADLQAATAHIQGLLAAAHAPVTDWYYATSHPEASVGAEGGESLYRKPGPGMLLAAATDHHIDLGRSWMVGDKDSDVIEDLLPGGLRCVLLAGEYRLSSPASVPRFTAHAPLLAYIAAATTPPPP